MKKKLLVLAGSGNCAVWAINHLSEQEDLNVVVFEESNYSPLKIVNFLKNKFFKEGTLWCIDFLFGRLFSPKAKLETKKYSPKLFLEKFDLGIKQKIEAESPDWILSCACSVLDKEFVSYLNDYTGKKVINIHNGITPKYRGIGNKWALIEGNFQYVGVTLHHLSKGIDTGEIISNKKMNLSSASFELIDEHAFLDGAKLVHDLITKDKKEVEINPGQISSYYSYLTYTELQRSQQNLKRKNEGHNIDKAWLESFTRKSQNENLNEFQQMEWSNYETIKPRDEVITRIFNETIPMDGNLLDIGCGDGRYEKLLPQFKYFGCDYSSDFVERIGRENIRVGNAYELDAFDDSSMSAVLCGGLFQHLGNPAKCAAEIDRVLKPGGHVVVSTLKQFTLIELIMLLPLILTSSKELFLRILRKDYLNSTLNHGDLIARRYTPREIRRLFGTKNYKVIYTENYLGMLSNLILNREVCLVLKKNESK